ncbi:MAG: flagellar biosynthesis repressor FlbT [Beijerinckiaceae bacterium]
MALKVELKPGEKIIIGTVALRNGDQRARFFIEGQAPILREKDILTAERCDSPAKHLYFAVQLMYVEGSIEKHHDLYFQFAQDFVRAAPSATALIAEINNRILSGDFYKALKTAKELIAYEQKLMASVAEPQRGVNDESGAGLRKDGAADAAGS